MRVFQDGGEAAGHVVAALNAAGESPPDDGLGLLKRGIDILSALETWTVYCFAVPSGHRKIGITEGNCGARLAALQTGNHQRIAAEFAIAVTPEAARQIERAAHDRLAKHRREGEWFECSRADAQEVVEGSYQRYAAAWWRAYCANVGLFGVNPTVPRYRVDVPDQTLPMKCEVCGDAFDAERSTARFCGPTCRQRHGRRLIGEGVV